MPFSRETISRKTCLRAFDTVARRLPETSPVRKDIPLLRKTINNIFRQNALLPGPYRDRARAGKVYDGIMRACAFANVLSGDPDHCTQFGYDLFAALPKVQRHHRHELSAMAREVETFIAAPPSPTARPGAGP